MTTEAKSGHVYKLTTRTALSGAAEVLTVQQPTSPTKVIRIKRVLIDATVACAITIERDGVAASTTAQTPVPVSNKTPASTALGYNTSNATSVTVLANHGIPANSLPIELPQDTTLFDASSNFTVRTASITGTVNITIEFEESARA